MPACAEDVVPEVPEEIIDAWERDKTVGAVMDLFTSEELRGKKLMSYSDVFRILEILGLEREDFLESFTDESGDISITAQCRSAMRAAWDEDDDDDDQEVWYEEEENLYEGRSRRSGPDVRLEEPFGDQGPRAKRGKASPRQSSRGYERWPGAADDAYSDDDDDEYFGRGNRANPARRNRYEAPRSRSRSSWPPVSDDDYDDDYNADYRKGGSQRTRRLRPGTDNDEPWP